MFLLFALIYPPTVTLIYDTKEFCALISFKHKAGTDDHVLFM